MHVRQSELDYAVLIKINRRGIYKLWIHVMWNKEIVGVHTTKKYQVSETLDLVVQ